MEFSLAKLSCAGRLLVALFVVALLVGYGVAFLQIAAHTHFSPQEVIEEYRGSQDPEAMAEPKSYRSLLMNTHAHALSVPVVYFLLGVLFAMGSSSQRVKCLCIAVLFGGFFLDYAGLWGLRYLHTAFAYVSFMAHAVTAPVYLLMCVRILCDLRHGGTPEAC